MGKVVLLALLLICKHFTSLSANNEDYKILKGKEYVLFRNQKIVTDVIREFKSRSKLQCAAKCYTSRCDVCTSIAFNSRTSRCILYNNQNINNYISVPEPAWTFYWIIDWCPVDQGFTYNAQVHICYKGINGARTFTESVHLCQQINATLPTLETEVRNSFFSDVLRNDNIEGTYIHAYRSGNDWFWHCGSAFKDTFTNWNLDLTQPQNRPTEDYVAIIKKYNFKWHDSFNSYETGTICEIKKP